MQSKLEDGLSEKQIPLFVDWFTEKLHFVEIKTSSTKDAYKIFETMNDRGLRLAPAEMLKGYLLSEVHESELRDRANEAWKKKMDELTERKGEDADAIKSWLRARHANKLSDFEEIGSQFHRWVRNNSDALKLQTSENFAQFIMREFVFYVKIFQRLRLAAEKYAPELGLECVYYLSQHSFTLQYPLLLASLEPGDPEKEIDRKLRVVSTYLDILVHRRIGNWKRIAESTMRGQIFSLIPEIRDKGTQEIAELLAMKLEKDEPGPTLAPEFGLHKQNRPSIHRILARITDYVEKESALPSHYSDYFVAGKESFQIEHIWHSNYEKVCQEEHMDQTNLRENDFSTLRDYIGGLLLLPQKDNASYGDIPYVKKREYYYSQNLLARSLHENCYSHNPGFIQFKNKSRLPFEPHQKVQKADIEKRQTLCREIADKLWNPDRLHEAANE